MDMGRRTPKCNQCRLNLKCSINFRAETCQLPSFDPSLNDDQRFVHAALVMLDAREIKLLDEDGLELPKWKWSEILKSNAGNPRVQITDGGIKRIA